MPISNRTGKCLSSSPVISTPDTIRLAAPVSKRITRSNSICEPVQTAPVPKKRLLRSQSIGERVKTNDRRNARRPAAKRLVGKKTDASTANVSQIETPQQQNKRTKQTTSQNAQNPAIPFIPITGIQMPITTFDDGQLAQNIARKAHESVPAVIAFVAKVLHESTDFFVLPNWPTVLAEHFRAPDNNDNSSKSHSVRRPRKRTHSNRSGTSKRTELSALLDVAHNSFTDATPDAPVLAAKTPEPDSTVQSAHFYIDIPETQAFLTENAVAAASPPVPRSSLHSDSEDLFHVNAEVYECSLATTPTPMLATMIEAEKEGSGSATATSSVARADHNIGEGDEGFAAETPVFEADVVMSPANGAAEDCYDTVARADRNFGEEDDVFVAETQANEDCSEQAFARADRNIGEKDDVYAAETQVFEANGADEDCYDRPTQKLHPTERPAMPISATPQHSCLSSPPIRDSRSPIICTPYTFRLADPKKIIIAYKTFKQMQHRRSYVQNLFGDSSEEDGTDDETSKTASVPRKRITRSKTLGEPDKTAPFVRSRLTRSNSNCQPDKTNVRQSARPLAAKRSVGKITDASRAIDDVRLSARTSRKDRHVGSGLRTAVNPLVPKENQNRGRSAGSHRSQVDKTCSVLQSSPERTEADPTTLAGQRKTALHETLNNSDSSYRVNTGTKGNSKPHHSPSVPKPRVLFTLVNPGIYAASIAELGGTVVQTPHECTVLVTNKVVRTSKFLAVMARGVNIVSEDWLRACAKHRRFVALDEFVLSDKEAEKRFQFQLSVSLAAARLRPIFARLSFYVTPGTICKLVELNDIIVCAGGHCMLSLDESPRHGDTVLAVSCINDGHLWPQMLRDHPGMLITSFESLMQSITQQKLVLKAH